jgi:DNA-binding winged helix-turn-helix (wHTH) protein
VTEILEISGATLSPWLGGAMDGGNGNLTIRFSVFELDLKAGELRRNGSRVRLQEQPLQILVSLLERPGEVVGRDELRKKLWAADTFVDFDHGLNAAIRRLRDALGDSADTPRFVETVARRGYRFIAPLSQPLPSAAIPAPGAPHETGPGEGAGTPKAVSGQRQRIWLLGIAIVAALVACTLVAWRLGHRTGGQATNTQRRLTANRAELPIASAALSPT